MTFGFMCGITLNRSNICMVVGESFFSVLANFFAAVHEREEDRYISKKQSKPDINSFW